MVVDVAVELRGLLPNAQSRLYAPILTQREDGTMEKKRKQQAGRDISMEMCPAVLAARDRDPLICSLVWQTSLGGAFEALLELVHVVDMVVKLQTFDSEGKAP